MLYMKKNIPFDWGEAKLQGAGFCVTKVHKLARFFQCFTCFTLPKFLPSSLVLDKQSGSQEKKINLINEFTFINQKACH